MLTLSSMENLIVQCNHDAYIVLASVIWNETNKQNHRSIGIIEPRCEKTCLRVSDQVPHKPGCTTTQDG